MSVTHRLALLRELQLDIGRKSSNELGKHLTLEWIWAEVKTFKLLCCNCEHRMGTLWGGYCGLARITISLTADDDDFVPICNGVLVANKRSIFLIVSKSLASLSSIIFVSLQHRKRFSKINIGYIQIKTTIITLGLPLFRVDTSNFNDSNFAKIASCRRSKSFNTWSSGLPHSVAYISIFWNYSAMKRESNLTWEFDVVTLLFWIMGKLYIREGRSNSIFAGMIGGKRYMDVIFFLSKFPQCWPIFKSVFSSPRWEISELL